MPDLRRESLGKKSQKPKFKVKTKPDDEDEVEENMTEETETETEAQATPDNNESEQEAPATEEQPTTEEEPMPDIAAENDVASVPKGEKFLARFLNDPNGDTGHHAKQIMGELLSGRVSRHGLSTTYWKQYSETRPPMAVSEGNGKYHVVEG